MKNIQWQSEANLTQRISSIKRNRNTMYNQSQQQYVNLLARIRLLEDEVLSEKIKAETFQRKSYQYIETIAQLEYTIGDLKFFIDKTQGQAKRYSDIQKQIENYSLNLRDAGQQLFKLNDLVQKKSKQCQKLQQLNAKIHKQNIQYQQKFKQMSKNRELEKNKLRHILESISSECEPSFSQELIQDMELVDQAIFQLKQSLSKTKNALQKNRKQHSELIMKQKQKIIQLEYGLKLAQKRNIDLQKRKNMQSAFIVDQKVQDIIQQFLKKQEEMSARIGELQLQNNELKQKIQSDDQSRRYLNVLKKSDLQKELKQAKSMIKQLIQQKSELSDQVSELSYHKQIQSNRSMSQQIDIGNKYRKCCQQNKRLKLKLNQLQSDKKLLEKQLSLRAKN